MIQPTINDSTILFLIDCEGKKSKAYKDSVGKWTIGIGHCIKLPKEQYLKDKTLTEKEIQDLLISDLNPCINAINKYVSIQLNQYQFNALCAFIINEGCEAFRTSTLLKKINLNASKEDIEKEFLRWNKIKANGKYEVSKGLVNRRKKEVSLYFHKAMI